MLRRWKSEQCEVFFPSGYSASWVTSVSFVDGADKLEVAWAVISSTHLPCPVVFPLSLVLKSVVQQWGWTEVLTFKLYYEYSHFTVSLLTVCCQNETLLQMCLTRHAEKHTASDIVHSRRKVYVNRAFKWHVRGAELGWEGINCKEVSHCFS